MKKILRNLAVASISMVAALCSFNALADEDLQNQAQQAVANFQSADSSLRPFMDAAAGYAVFPDVGKGGLIIGGAHGKGLVYEKGAVTGRATMTQASIGAQAGGQSFAQIICFQNPEALNRFRSGKFEMSAEVSAVAATEGASRAARYTQGVAVFTMPKKGLMVSASVGGQKFKYEPLAATGR